LRRAHAELMAVIDEMEAISRSKRPRTHLRRLVARLRAETRAPVAKRSHDGS